MENIGNLKIFENTQRNHRDFENFKIESINPGRTRRKNLLGEVDDLTFYV